ncbi:hypothetical protein M4D56_01960 [Cytobacillus oceanisediminis]|uniref:hypothetical protein n=1 Tax=Cytobacillus oceanisediminis TaxID=665099 RepID=UPI0020425A00|nr:hypothetical protein [Cytobacillus oceanisediminis]MCM3527860.1 hypothetical protein [Cytobacillus oceanisediminis]
MFELIVQKAKGFITNETVLEMFEVAGEFVPVLGVLRVRKLNRAVRRIEENRKYIEKLNSITGLTKQSVEFFSEKILPIALEDFYNEHEDAKIQYLINGMYNVILEENHEESVIYHFLETYRNLHYSDIRRLFYIAKIDEEDYFLSEKLIPIIERTENKLEREGLVILPISKTIPSNLMSFNSGSGITETRLTEFGNNFLNFISEKS